MARKKAAATGHHSVYVVYLRDPKGDGRAGYYVFEGNYGKGFVFSGKFALHKDTKEIVITPQK